MKCQKHNENMTMANDDTSIDSVNQRERKPERTEKQKKKKKIVYKHGNKKCFTKGKRSTKGQKLDHFERVCLWKLDARKEVKFLEEEDCDYERYVGQ